MTETNSGTSELWVEKYRPVTLDDYILNSKLKKYFQDMIDRRSLQNLLFSGPAGMGKTTLVRLLAKNVGAETIFIPCGTDGTLDVLRTKITDFCNAMTFDGRQKVVILDELDSSSSASANNFQMALRNVIEKSSADTRFLCTCNFSNKILPAILSRCPLVPLKFDGHDLLGRVRTILDAEKVEYDKTSLKAFIEESFRYYPDCRRIINYLQFCCSSGKLVVNFDRIVDSDKNSFLAEIVEKTLKEKNLLDVRRFYLGNKSKISDFVALGSDFYNKVVDEDLLDADGILKMTDLLYMLDQCVDKESMFFGMVTALRKYKK